MKKLFITAVALVAFGSASFANTISDQEIIQENLEKIENQETAPIFPWEFLVTLNECVGVYNEVKSTYTPVLGSQQATAIAQGAFVGCMGGI